jgi:hypothetical protein
MENEEKKPTTPEALITEAQAEFDECATEMTNVRKGNGFSWDEREELFYGGYFHVNDANTRERYMDSTGQLTTLAIDRAARVMAQLPSGRFENLSGDTGKNLLMNLLFDNYVIPNAGKSVPVLQTLRIADLHSDLYTIPIFVEWVAGDFYTGPKFVIVNPRRFYPQAGKESIGDMDHCFIDTYVTKDWLKTRDEKYFQNTKEIAAKANDTGPEATEVNAHDRLNKQSGILIRHRFKANGDWLAWNPDTKKVLIHEKKFYPRIPISLKQQYPRIGSIWSFTNFDRGFATQKKIDTMSAAETRAVEMMIDPPYIMDPAAVILSSFKRQPKAKWFVKKGQMDAVKPATIAPQALAAFSESYQISNAILLSMAAATDTAVSAKTDPGFGKSPEALKQQASRLGARDAWDQDAMKMCIEEAFSIAADEIAMKGVDPYSFTMMSDAIDRLKEDYPEENLDEFLNGNTFSVDRERVDGKYRYRMEPGSTIIGQEDTAETILGMLKVYAENEQIAADLAVAGERLDYGAAFKMILREKGSKFADKIIVSKKKDPEATAGIGSDGATVVPPEAEAEMMPPVQEQDMQESQAITQ